MSEYPEGWFRGTPGAGQNGGNPGSGDPTVDLPVGRRPATPPGRPAGGQPASGRPASGRSAAPPRGGWPNQPPPSSSSRGRGAVPGSLGAGQPAARGPASGPRGGAPGGSRPGAAPGGPSGYRPGAAPGGTGFAGAGGGRAWLRPRRIFGVLAVVVALLLVASVAMYFSLNGKLHREPILVSYAGQPVQGAGSNWLIAGSDSRQGLTAAQEHALSTGGAGIGGQRSDTIMILHMPPSGPPVLISIPRDSWVHIPGYGFNKINAAYSFGGPRLLADTVQNATGLRIDHYMEIGFGGFVNVVNAIGGVHMCVKYPLHDRASGLNISKGCQTLDGAQALGYVRDRHTYAQQDLQRIQDQRLFLKSLLSKLTSTGVLINPFAAIPAANGAASTLTVDEGTNLLQLAEVAFALRHPQTTTMPIANANFITASGQDAVLWNSSAAHSLFAALNAGKPVPKGLITGSSQAG
jgi:LCP family protein required for cell wall assembly